MAVDQCTCLPWDGFGIGDVRRIASDAFLLAAWASRPMPGEDVVSPDYFFEALAQNFEALLAGHAEGVGAGFLADGWGAGVARALEDIPEGWRPSGVRPAMRAERRRDRQQQRAQAAADKLRARRIAAAPIERQCSDLPLPDADPCSLQGVWR